MADISVQRGTANVPNTGGSTSPGVNFGSLASTIVFSACNRRTNLGWDGSAGNMEIDDLSGGVHLSAVDTIDLDRESTAASTTARFNWESWEYTGAGGGDDEFIVRGRYKLTLAGESATQAVSGISDIDDCIPFITGILVNNGGSTDDADSATAVAWMSAAGTLNVKRGSGANNTVQVYVTVVEFTGVNWAVKHGYIENNADSGVVVLRDAADGVTVGGGDVIDWGKAAIFHQYKANNLNGTDDSIADTSATYYPGGATTQVNWSFNSNHVDSVASGPSSGAHFVHVLVGSLSVSRFTDAQSGQGVLPVAVSGASISGTGTTAVEVSRSSSGTGTAYGRGWVGWNLASSDTLELWAHRSGNTISTRIQVIDFAPPIIGITDLDDEQIYSSETGNTATGFGFGVAQGTGKLELGSASTYGSSTLVAQIITAWSDTSIQFDAVKGALSEGSVWAYVTKDSGEVSSGYQVNLGRPAYGGVLLGMGANHYWPFQNSYADSIGTNPFNNVTSGDPNFTSSLLMCRGDTHSFEIDGTIADERIETADSPHMNTIAQQVRYMGGWITLDRIQKQLVVIYEEGAQVNNIAFLVGFGNILMVQVADTGDDYAQAYSDFKLKPGRTYHILFKFEASAQDAEVRLFIDGVLQQRTSGNPWTASDLDAHSGNIAIGHQPGESLEVGGTDIAFSTPTKCFYAHWLTWKTVVSPSDIRLKLFEQGVRPGATIASDTAGNMQIAFSAYDDTGRPDVPLAILVEEPTDGASLTLTANGLTFDPRGSIHIQWVGSGILTLVNGPGAEIDEALCSALGAGSIVVQNPAVLTISGIITGSEVRIYDDNGSSGSFGTELAGVETLTGTSFAYSHSGATNDIMVQVMKTGWVELGIPHTLNSTDQTLTVVQKPETN